MKITNALKEIVIVLREVGENRLLFHCANMKVPSVQQTREWKPKNPDELILMQWGRVFDKKNKGLWSFLVIRRKNLGFQVDSWGL